MPQVKSGLTPPLRRFNLPLAQYVVPMSQEPPWRERAIFRQVEHEPEQVTLGVLRIGESLS